MKIKKVKFRYFGGSVPLPTTSEGDLATSVFAESDTWGELLGIRGGGVPPGSPNSDPISDQNMPFFIPVFRPHIYVYKSLNYVTIA